MTEQTASGPGPSTGATDHERGRDDTELGPDDENELGGGGPEDDGALPRARWRAETILPWALVAALVLIGLALLWSAAEAHYQGCVQQVGVRTAGDNSALGRFARQDVTKCSRSPF